MLSHPIQSRPTHRLLFHHLKTWIISTIIFLSFWVSETCCRYIESQNRKSIATHSIWMSNLILPGSTRLCWNYVMHTSIQLISHQKFLFSPLKELQFGLVQKMESARSFWIWDPAMWLWITPDVRIILIFMNTRQVRPCCLSFACCNVINHLFDSNSSLWLYTPHFNGTRWICDSWESWSETRWPTRVVHHTPTGWRNSDWFSLSLYGIAFMFSNQHVSQEGLSYFGSSSLMKVLSWSAPTSSARISSAMALSCKEIWRKR